MMTEPANYRVKIASEVILGADDNLLEGTEVTVQAYSPALAIIAALEAAKSDMLVQLRDSISEEELMSQLGLSLSEALSDLGKAVGIEMLSPASTRSDVPDASATPKAAPTCINCDHRLDHHDGGGPCLIEECPCKEYRLSRPS